MVVAVVLCVTESGKEREIWEIIKTLSSVEEAFIVYGEFDIAIKINSSDFKEIDLIVKRIKNISGVFTTSTLLASEVYRREVVYDDKTEIY